MTVLQRKEAMGVDSAKLGKIVGAVALVGAIGFGFAFALSNIDGTDTVAPAAIGASQGLTNSAQTNQALNSALVTAASASGPFLAGHPSQTHKGRNSATPASGSEWSTVGDPISVRIPDYPQGEAVSASGDAAGSNRGDLLAR